MGEKIEGEGAFEAESTAKKMEELEHKVSMMLDFRKVEALNTIIKNTENLTDEEIDYLSEYTRLLDFKMGLGNSHFAGVAQKGIEEIRANLEGMKENVREILVKKLEFLEML